MQEILLLEADYKNKYPPLGLMKISYYHKNRRGDHVRFSKGRLPESLKSKKWDRVYVTTLFTFEWEAYKDIINYALEVAKDPSRVFIGGIAVTLMPEKFHNEFSCIPRENIVTGLLNVKGKLGYEDDGDIDTITPDYSILEDIRPWKYPFENAYFMYTTRGCGMKCGFCAVQTLEPKYEPCIKIADKIAEINEKYGTKKDLLLMDNNVLKSPRFNEIIDELIKIGFSKGATYKSPATGKFVNRYIDFNQGLDANLLSEERAKKLAELAIKPARIAFDHIEDKDTYEKAIRRCTDNGIKELSNYILYNSDDFTGKGKDYEADTPLDLYNRLKITMDLKDEINENLSPDEKISIFSFPMRYIPLGDDKRGYVGSKWNMKYLRAIQRMLIPTQGKGVSSRSFFEADFGTSGKEYLEILAMPEDIIAARGRFVEKKGESSEERTKRLQQWEENRAIQKEWQDLFGKLGNKNPLFIDIIKNNIFSIEEFLKIEDLCMQKLYLYYLSENKFLMLLNELKEPTKIEVVHNYCVKEFPLFLKRISDYIYNTKVQYSKLIGFLKIFKDIGLRSLLEIWINDNYKNDYLIGILERVLSLEKINLFEFTLIKTFKSYTDFGCLSEDYIHKAQQYIKELNNTGLLDILMDNYGNFKNALTESVVGAAGEKELKKQINMLIDEIHKQLSIFDLVYKTEVR